MRTTLASIARFAQRTFDIQAAQHVSRTTGQDARENPGLAMTA